MTNSTNKYQHESQDQYQAYPKHYLINSLIKVLPTSYNYSTSCIKSQLKVSVRPSGWHLPSSTGTGSYSTLVQNYVGREKSHNSSLPILINPLNFIRFGFYVHNQGNLFDQSSSAYYWSQTHDGTIKVYYLEATSSYFSLNFSTDRGFGFPLRCLAR